MLDLYQMVDPNFMPHLREVGGQLFVREVQGKDIVMVTGVLSAAKGIRPEHQYFCKVSFDLRTEVDRTEVARAFTSWG